MFETDNTAVSNHNGQSNNNLNFGIAGAVEYHFAMPSEISPYVGGQISYFNSGQTSNSGGFSTTSTSTIFGVDALAGAEFFVGRNVSFSVEYQYGIRTTSNSGTNQFQLGFQGASLTMGIYF